MLLETESAPENDVNSIVKLLQIQPAHVDKLQLNAQESVFFDMFKSLNQKISLLTNQINSNNKNNNTDEVLPNYLKPRSNGGLTFYDILQKSPSNLTQYIYRNWDGVIGNYVGIDKKNQLVFKLGNKTYTYPNIKLSWQNIFVEDVA